MEVVKSAFLGSQLSLCLVLCRFRSSDWINLLFPPTGLQHPRQRRAALPGTLQPAPQPPRAGKPSNGGGDALAAPQSRLNARTSIQRDLSFMAARWVSLTTPLHRSGFSCFSSNSCEHLHVNVQRRWGWWWWGGSVERMFFVFLLSSSTCWGKELNLRMKCWGRFPASVKLS